MNLTVSINQSPWVGVQLGFYKGHLQGDIRLPFIGGIRFGNAEHSASFPPEAGRWFQHERHPHREHTFWFGMFEVLVFPWDSCGRD